MEFFHKVTRFPFMNTRKVWYGLSALLIVASIGLVALRGLNLGVDFTGGVVVDTNFRQCARYPGSPAARPERKGRADRRARARSFQHGAKRRQAAERGGGRSAG